MREIIFFLFLFLIRMVFSQNLVPNSSFEEYITCDITCCTLQYTVDWFNPLPSTSPDYYLSCAPDNVTSGIPSNATGYQEAKEGNAYVGCFASQISPIPNIREYVSAKLIDSLGTGKMYYVSYYVSLAENFKQYVSTMGAYFSSSANIPSQSFMLSAVPQIENSLQNSLNDTVQWMKITGNFIAHGGEQYITLGNFKDEASCGLASRPADMGVHNGAYYYIDDVCVSLNPADCGIDTTTTNVAEVVKRDYSFKIFPNPTQENLNMVYLSGDNENLSITITNMLGQDVLNNKPLSIYGADVLNTSTLTNGIYFLKIMQNGQHLGTKKFLIEKNNF